MGLNNTIRRTDGRAGDFGFLDETISILIVEDDPYFSNIYQKVLGKYRLYNLCIVESAAQAEEKLLQSPGYSVCVLDLGITDRQQDEFYLLRRYTQKAAFVVVSGAESPQKGSITYTLGARDAIQKGSIAEMRLIERINNVFLDYLLVPPGAEKDRLVVHAASVLRGQKPKMVKEWARKSDIGEALLRRKYEQYGNEHKPRIIMMLYTLYNAAFLSYAEKGNGNKGSDTKSAVHTASRQPEIDLERYKHLFESNWEYVRAILGLPQEWLQSG